MANAAGAYQVLALSRPERRSRCPVPLGQVAILAEVINHTDNILIGKTKKAASAAAQAAAWNYLVV
jgi:hypothetical protein